MELIIKGARGGISTDSGLYTEIRKLFGGIQNQKNVLYPKYYPSIQVEEDVNHDQVILSS